MYDDILIPTDGERAARKGAKHAIDLAATVGATVHPIYVIDLPGVPRALSIRDDEEELRRRYRAYGEDVTTEIGEMAAEAGVEYVTALKTGTIHEEIAEYAEDEDIDLIVMGTGYRGVLSTLLGGTAEKVVRTSAVPITTVRMGEYE